jgi:Caspase domain
MRSLGAIVLGISSYRYGLEIDEVPALKYPVSDADAILTYLRTCWPVGSDAKIEPVHEASADIGGLDQAFTKIANAGPYDLFIVYLSGHGTCSMSKTGFILQPEHDGRLAVATADKLDQLLSLVKAKRTAFILDCCFAEAVIAGMQFFNSLDGDEARLFIGSSRADQLTWEDDDAKHGVFTAHLVDMLNAGNAVRSTIDPDRVQVDAELFPFLCDQVLDRKGAKQEPIKGGISSSAMTLPTVAGAQRPATHGPRNRLATSQTDRGDGAQLYVGRARTKLCSRVLCGSRPERRNCLAQWHALARADISLSADPAHADRNRYLHAVGRHAVEISGSIRKLGRHMDSCFRRTSGRPAGRLLLSLTMPARCACGRMRGVYWKTL